MFTRCGARRSPAKNLYNMDEVQLKLNEKGEGKFYIVDDEGEVGEMAVVLDKDILTVHHTEVLERAEGKGYAKKLLTAMVDHARKNNWKVIALCPYVHLQFRRRPDDYADIWLRDQRGLDR